MPLLTAPTDVLPTNLGEFFTAPDRVAWRRIPQPLQISLLKSDTEGYEPVVFETALRILPSIANILVEVFPALWEKNGIPRARGDAVFECLFAAGMEAVSLPRRDVDFHRPGD